MAADRRLPPWLLGLIFAVILFVIFLVVTSLLGIGDDPGVEGMARYP